ncbi:MAG: hypothetical protein K8R69_00770 [Deltaproteobacteria bacterium]|nr:hypothetical protein [Deltaproteobacteria bacterium]
MKMTHKVFISSLGVAALALPRLAFSGDCAVTVATDTLPAVAGELRDCVENVATSDGDTITIGSGLTVDVDEGPMNIAASIRIVGAGVDNSAVNGLNNGPERLFNINGSGNFAQFSGFSIFNSNNVAPGGAIFVDSGTSLSIDTVNIDDCSSDVDGGAIYHDGSLNLKNVKITSTGASGSGGTIYTTGNLFIEGSTFTGNSAQVQGGAIYQSDGTMQVVNSTVSENTAAGGAGGIKTYGLAILQGLTMDKNTATNGRGGALTTGGDTQIFDSEITNNETLTAGAAGIQNDEDLYVENTSIVGNKAGVNSGTDDGGGIHTDGSLTIISSTVADNTVNGGNGAGIYEDSSGSIIERCTISGNKNLNAGSGGGLYINGNFASLLNSTVFGNETPDFGGGVYASYPLVMVNSTVVGNSATQDGGGIYVDEESSLANSIVAGNSATGAGPDCFNNSILNSVAPNLIQDTTDCDTAGVAPLTGAPGLAAALADNGGPTQTLALIEGSQAIDAGDNGSCLATDQRGVSRPQGENCDLGAFELGGDVPPVTPTPSPTATPVPPPPVPNINGGGCSLADLPNTGSGVLWGFLTLGGAWFLAFRRRLR